MAKPKDYEIPVPNYRLTYKDMFVFKSLYRTLYQWFDENGWRDQYGGMTHFEEWYVHRETGGGFYDISIIWNFQKKWKNENYMMKIQLEFLLLGGRIKEAVIEGEKVKGETGELTLFFRPKAVVNNAGWEKNPFLRRVRKPIFTQDLKDISETVKSYLYSKTSEVFQLAQTYLDTHAAFDRQDMIFHRKWEGV